MKDRCRCEAVLSAEVSAIIRRAFKIVARLLELSEVEEVKESHIWGTGVERDPCCKRVCPLKKGEAQSC